MPLPSIILITGAGGLIGAALCEFLKTGAHTIRRLSRRPDRANNTFRWNPQADFVDTKALSGAQAVVHLAGESLMGFRWTSEKKRRIYESRVRGTRLLAESLASLPEPPQVFISASAVGFYGNRGEEFLTEESAPGSGFLAEVCRDWEAAAGAARERGIRVVSARFGVVLSPHGGALRAMLPAFRMGLGGRIGSGGQYMSWISLADAVRALHFILSNDALSGPVNLVSPEPATNREFTRTLAKALNRPAVLPVPAFAVRLFLGEMGEEMLLSGTRVLPQRLLSAGFRFSHPSLGPAFEDLFK